MEIDTIIKRDGRVVPFRPYKISDAIRKAFEACGYEINNDIGETDVVNIMCSAVESLTHPSPTVEEVQDAVENALMAHNFGDVAKAYILYRTERTRAREANSRLMRAYRDITFTPSIDCDAKRENANINGDTAMGVMLKYGSEGARQYNSLYVLKPEHARAHANGDIHIHDMDFLTLTTTCTQIDLIKLFENGFSTGHGFLRKPNDIYSYSALCCIAIQANQNDQHGGQSIVNFDYAMADGVRATFRKRYRDNIVRAVSLISGLDVEVLIKSYMANLADKGLVPTLDMSDAYVEAEHDILSKIILIDADITRIQEFAIKNAQAETDRATYQAMEALVHNLNTMSSRAGAQVPFSSINYGMDTSPEGRMAVRNVLLATEAGLGHGETPIFPIQIFRVKEGINFNPDEPNYDLFKLACRVSAKRLFPNFSFQDAPYNLQYYKKGHPETEIAYMGCRTRVIGNVYDPNQEVSNGRGNLSFTSINLPRLAIEAHGDQDVFFSSLDKMLDLVVDQLTERFEIQASRRVRNYPFLMGQGVWLESDRLGWEDEVRDVLKHGTLSIGFIGLAEALVALTGKHHGESSEAQELGLHIIRHMRTRCDDESKRRQMNYTLLATPAEGLSGRFVKMDAQKYGKIAGVTDREYYTNSFHVPVYYHTSVAQKIRLEAPYHALTNAGHITYVELDGDPSNNIEAFEKIIRLMHDCGIGYGSINHPVDRDPVCGYNGIIGDECPQCGRREGSQPFERIRRITGYLVGTLDRWNDAKRAEERDRVKHEQ